MEYVCVCVWVCVVLRRKYAVPLVVLRTERYERADRSSSTVTQGHRNPTKMGSKFLISPSVRDIVPVAVTRCWVAIRAAVAAAATSANNVAYLRRLVQRHAHASLTITDLMEPNSGDIV